MTDSNNYTVEGLDHLDLSNVRRRLFPPVNTEELRARLTAYIQAHPGVTTTAILHAFQVDTWTLLTTLDALKQEGILK